MKALKKILTICFAMVMLCVGGMFVACDTTPAAQNPGENPGIESPSKGDENQGTTGGSENSGNSGGENSGDQEKPEDITEKIKAEVETAFEEHIMSAGLEDCAWRVEVDGNVATIFIGLEYFGGDMDFAIMELNLDSFTIDGYEVAEPELTTQGDEISVCVTKK